MDQYFGKTSSFNLMTRLWCWAKNGVPELVYLKGRWSSWPVQTRHIWARLEEIQISSLDDVERCLGVPCSSIDKGRRFLRPSGTQALGVCA
jgi:hypothetical protein